MIGLDEAESIALAFVNRKDPESDTLGQHDAPVYIHRNQLKSVQKHSKGWSVVVETIKTSSFSTYGTTDTRVRTWFWTILIDSEGRILEYSMEGPYEKGEIWEPIRPSESHIHIYEHEKNDEEEEEKG